MGVLDTENQDDRDNHTVGWPDGIKINIPIFQIDHQSHIFLLQ